MTDKRDDESGVERRDLLKGLGVGAVGSSLLAGRAAARQAQAEGTDLIDYAALVAPGDDPDEPKSDVQDRPDEGLPRVPIGRTRDGKERDSHHRLRDGSRQR
ncbi:hypothetical protein [Halorussus caseinilyticus]|uniref:Twin-arginine translocation signal domain-containing protein n=1 Tax=Halorussus caseinilyticus TaxID=3034025 RepID=A0ABD5WLD4_9EURY